MEIVLNHKKEKLDTKETTVTVEELLSIKNFTFELLIVKINGNLIKKENYSSTKINPKDEVQVIHVFGGG